METEVLRISGNVTVPKWDGNFFVQDFETFIREKWQGQWSGSIVPQDDESGMRLYRVEEVERLNDAFGLSEMMNKAKAQELQLAFKEINLMGRKLNDAEKSRDFWKLWYTEACSELHRLRNKETRWRTFIKWWKQLWK